MKNIFKHLDNIEISSIADNEASRSTTFFFKFHKIFCGKCREEFSNYKLLNLKISQSFKLINPRTRSEKLVYIYKLTSKVAVYLFIASLSLSSVGITYAQAQTDEDIIPEIKIFEDGEIISFSEEEIENLFTEVVDPIQATLITFFTTETITSESVTKEVEEQVNVLTTLIEQSKSVDQPGLAAEAIIVDVVIEAAEEVVEDAIEDVNQVVKDAEGIVDEEIVELKDLKNALKEIDENIKIAIAQNNSDALNGLQNTRENILKSIQEVEKEIETAKEKAGEEIEKAKEKAGEEIEKAKEKAGEILSEIKPEDSEKEVVKAQLKAERTLDKAKEKAEKELDEAKEKAEKELDEAKEKAEKEIETAKEKAGEEIEKAKEKAEK